MNEDEGQLLRVRLAEVVPGGLERLGIVASENGDAGGGACGEGTTERSYWRPEARPA